MNPPLNPKIPHLSFLLDDLPMSRLDVAKYLDVTPRTLRRWEAAGQAPKAVMIALYWVSSWGLDWHDKGRANTEALLRSCLQGLEGENKMLRARITRLELMGDYGAANSPLVNGAATSLQSGRFSTV